MILLVVLLLAVNLVISFFNCRTLGKSWVEMTHAGIGSRILAWLFAIMPAAGFTWSYLILIVMGFLAAGKLSVDAATAALNLGYVLIIPGVLVSGFAIMLRSWAIAYRTRQFGDIAVGGWNTFAQVYNTYNAVQGFGPALSDALGFLFGGKGKKDGAWLVMVLVVLAAAGGTLTTVALIRHYAASDPAPALPQCTSPSRIAQRAYHV